MTKVLAMQNDKRHIEQPFLKPAMTTIFVQIEIVNSMKQRIAGVGKKNLHKEQQKHNKSNNAKKHPENKDNKKSISSTKNDKRATPQRYP